MNSTSTVNSPVVYAELTKAVSRLAGTAVKDPYQLATLHFIVDRTFTFQKLSEVIPVRHFLGGVQRKKGGMVCAGLRMSEAKLFAVLRACREAGILLTTKVGRRVRYAINLQWVISLAPPSKREVVATALSFEDREWGAAEARENPHTVEVLTPENLHEVEVKNKEHCPFRTREGEKSNARKLASDADRVASPSSTEEDGAHAPVETLPAVAPALQTARPAQTKAVPPVSDARRAQAVSRDLWASTLSDRFDATRRQFWPDAGVPQAPSGKLRGQWEHFAKSWRRTDIAVGDWVEWSVENWRVVYATVFRHVETRQEEDRKKFVAAPWGPKGHWRTPVEFPEYPDFGFLLVYHRSFLKEYDRRDSQRLRSNNDFKERNIRFLMFRGYSYADAEAKTAEAEARMKRREDLDALARDLMERSRRLTAKEQDIDNRIAIGRSYRAVNPGSLIRVPLKPKFNHAIDMDAPLPPFPEWRDDLDEADASKGGDLSTIHAVAA